MAVITNDLTGGGITMNNQRLKKHIGKFLLTPVILLSMNSFATAATIWTDWTTRTLGDPAGAASGIMDSITVNYSGDVYNAVINGTTTIWNPSTTFIGGAVDTSPDSVGDVIGLNGSSTVDMITFSSPVSNPVIAIWSLGSPTIPATFTFDATPTLQAGGPNSSYGGSSLVVNGNTVSGNEGNGVILFSGTYSSISWTSTNENWIGFTVGTAVPVPAALWLFSSGLMGLVGLARKKAA
jgi:hypothetical protein